MVTMVTIYDMAKAGSFVEMDFAHAMMQQKAGMRVSRSWAKQFVLCSEFSYTLMDTVSGKNNLCAPQAHVDDVHSRHQLRPFVNIDKSRHERGLVLAPTPSKTRSFKGEPFAALVHVSSKQHCTMSLAVSIDASIPFISQTCFAKPVDETGSLFKGKPQVEVDFEEERAQEEAEEEGKHKLIL
eukprot:5685960-Amphidinium_carterae.1